MTNAGQAGGVPERRGTQRLTGRLELSLAKSSSALTLFAAQPRAGNGRVLRLSLQLM